MTNKWICVTDHILNHCVQLICTLKMVLLSLLYFLYVSVSVGDTTDDDVIESAGVYLFTIFKSVDKVSHKETNNLKSVFGPFPASVATATCAVVGNICKTLPDDIVASLGKEERQEADGAAAVTEFGHGIKFVYPAPVPENDEMSSSESDEERQPEVDLQYKHTVKKKAPPENKKKQTGNSSHDAEWLQKEVAKYYGTDVGMRLEDFSSTIFDVLSSPKSDSELQNDVRKCLYLNSYASFSLEALVETFNA